MPKTFWLLSAGLTALAAPAYAQDQPQPGTATTTTDAATTAQDDTGAGQNEIVITAQGRRQLLQDVPLAVQAVGAEQLQNSGATDIRQLNQLAPSLLVSSTGTEANGSARIRGIGTVGDNPGLESSVAVFIDGVYRSRSGIGLNELGEIERVEVLRGPQGTLFGRNASAGLIHVITRRPEFEFGGMAELTYGNYNYVRAQGAVTGPISEALAFRLDAVYARRDGFYDVVNASGGTEDEVNDRNRLFVRGQLLFEPSDALSIRIIGDYTTREESCCGAVYTQLRETFDPTPGVPGDFSVAASNRIVGVLQSLGGIFPSAGDPYNREIAITPGTSYEGKTEEWGVSGQIDWDIGGATLTSITAYRDYRSEQPGDVDYNNVDILRRNDDGNAFRQFQTFSQELRLQGSAFNGFLDWLVGGYFASENLDLSDNLSFGSQYGAFAACRLVATVNPTAALRNPALPGCLSPAGRAALSAQLGAAAPIILAGIDRLSTVNNVGDNTANYFQDSTNWAIFTHNIFNITDELSITLGLRYTSEKKDFSANFNNTNTICPVQQAFFAPFITGGAAALPPALQSLAQGIVNLTCQGNSSASLNALNLEDERDEDEWTGTAVLSYRPNNRLLVYGSYSRGYKAGGFNLDRSALGLPIFSPTDPRNIGGRGAPFGTLNLQFDPEIVDAYEVGFKWTNRNFTLNFAAFHQEFTNFQLNTFNGSVFLVQNINGCGADLGSTDSDQSPTSGACGVDDVEAGVLSTGFEVEAALYPHRDITITAGFTYANTRYRDNLVGRDTGTPLDPALFLLPGDNLSNAPEYVVTTSFAWTPEIGSSGLSALVYADARLTGDYNTGSDLFPEKEQDGYAIVNARLGIRGPAQRWAIELWAQNLFDVDYQQVAFSTPFQGSGPNNNTVAQVQQFGAPTSAFANQFTSAFLAEPRTFGITGRFRF
ncbi:TonB-dependent receptor [Sphingosinicella sp. LHD-64]|uniref:TonB-dependent receptor n=1 Tax=Sphingosinicella sp. LHD-64 TaxID=3072139 RepID=UPI00280EDA9F|nr:TonB-dependent receptor [Sphingosinicella sp. LHD-64]MDQ8756980.1 TonB-dependent receptor [Sphingosinicella sp. LHD-64]